MKKIASISIAMAILAGCSATQEQTSAPVAEQNTVAQTKATLTKEDRKNAQNDDRGHRAMPMTEKRLAWILEEYKDNGDKQLTWAEYNDFRKQRFDKTDANNSGVVDAEEYVYEFENRLDSRYEQGRKAHVKQTNRRFESLDKNDNASIEWSEYQASGDRIFARWDTNNDGKVDSNDPKKEHKANGSSWNSRNPVDFIRMPSTHTLKGLKDIYDANKDDVVTADEFNNERRSVFYITDSNKDGGLSQAEYLGEFEDRIDQTVSKSRRASIKQTYVRFNALDDNEDNQLTFEELQISGKRIFVRWDKNQDGVISSADVAASTVAKNAKY